MLRVLHSVSWRHHGKTSWKLARAEAMLFKYAAAPAPTSRHCAAGASDDPADGRPSGPMSFLKVYDAIASVVKSGAKTRARKDEHAQVWHPDIKDSSRAKPDEEKKAWALIVLIARALNRRMRYARCIFKTKTSVRVTDD